MTPHKIWLTALTFLMPAFVWALGMPSWVKHLPKAGNDTYYYRVTKAEGKTYEEAYSRAFSMAILESQWKLGVKVSKADDMQTVEQTVKQELNLKTGNMNLPMNKVCEYETASSDGGVLLYCLWQVATYGNVKAEFENYLDCE
ncbi:MAG: hypothetical protein II970_00240 [Paludibacteraceae bacterium]|nr:hypothetical protein [Paludibacteraceae bacterium]